MKRIYATFLMCGCLSGVAAQTQKTDSTTMNVSETVEQIYKNMLPILDRIQFTGNSAASQDVRERWNRVVNHLKNNSGNIAQGVKDLLISPSGKPIDLELLERLIKVEEVDSVKSVRINMDFFLDEMKAAGRKVTEAAKKMAETK